MAKGAPIEVTGDVLAGKRGLVMGVANNHSIAWGIARAARRQGAELAFTYQGEQFGKRVEPLARQAGSDILLPCDVVDDHSVASVFEAVEKEWGGLDFLVHAIAFSNKDELKGLYADTTRENFLQTMMISCYSFTEVARRAAALMPPRGEGADGKSGGGSLLTMTYGGAMRVMPNYNVMGVAKAALEASVRYLASDYGPRNIRVNAISAGPVRTLAGSGVSDARQMFNYQKRNAPLRRTVDIDEVGHSACYLLSDWSSGVTGEIHYVDSGYSTVSMPQIDELKRMDG